MVFIHLNTKIVGESISRRGFAAASDREEPVDPSVERMGSRSPEMNITPEQELAEREIALKMQF